MTGAIVGGVFGGVGCFCLTLGVLERRTWLVLAGASFIGGFLSALLAILAGVR